ncbi:MAG: hypothetical protein methR_P3524 [Methyloprofundus sp.]|nr:MAG: hypothetical protein methR_P3524 [Methyloprofundus sp.]
MRRLQVAIILILTVSCTSNVKDANEEIYEEFWDAVEVSNEMGHLCYAKLKETRVYLKDDINNIDDCNRYYAGQQAINQTIDNDFGKLAAETVQEQYMQSGLAQERNKIKKLLLNIIAKNLKQGSKL